MGAYGWAFAILGLLITWVCVLGLGLGIRWLLLRPRPEGELLLWFHLIACLVARLPDDVEHIGRINAIVSPSAPHLTGPVAYLSWIIPLSIELVLTWPAVVWVLVTFAPPDSPVAVRKLSALLIGVGVAAVLAPLVTRGLRARDERRAARTMRRSS